MAAIYSLLIYLDAYFVQAPVKNASQLLYGYKQSVEKISSLKDKYKTIVFDQSYDQPYIYFLFFDKYDPAKYQSQVSFQEGKNGDVGFVKQLDNIEFRPINWSADKHMKDTLLVGKPVAFPPEEIKKQSDYKVDTIYYPDGNAAFLFVDPV